MDPPRIPGTELDEVFAIRKDMEFLVWLKERIAGAKHVLIIGGGFGGVELPTRLRRIRAQRSRLLRCSKAALNFPMMPSFAMMPRKSCANGNRELYLDARRSAARHTSGKSVKLLNGKELKVDLVILGIGVGANTELARAAGLAIGKSGGIVVDRRMATSASGVFACGDCTEKVSFFGGQPSPLKLASIATQEARIAGANCLRCDGRESAP